MRKKIFVVVLFLVFIFGFLMYKISPLLGSGSIFMPSYKKINEFYNDNYVALQDVVNYMESVDSNFMRWDSFDKDVILKDNYDRIDISDNETMKINIQTLLHSDMQHILKENNYILFVLWSSLDSSCGILYSKRDNVLVEEIQLRKINDKGWYYFEHIA